MPRAFDIHAVKGLAEAEAAERLKAEGFNELPTARRRSVWAIALGVVREPMFLLLVACGLLYMLTGELTDAAMLLGFVFVVMGITIVQERRTERALDALRDLSSPRALVIRDGRQRRIAGREVVRDDVIVLAEGDRVPADAALMHAVNLSVDESLLTGESVPVRKAASDSPGEIGRPGGDDLPFVYSGTLVIRGHGLARAASTGLRTELGRIGKALQSLEPEETSLQRETGRLVRRLAVVGLSLCAVVVVLYALTRTGTLGSRAAWVGGFQAGIATAMATLPEEFPVVLTVFLALGAWRMSRKRVLTRRMPAVETLGAATVLCVDKTGTLTMNQMSVSKLHAGGEAFDAADPANTALPERFHELLEFGILASRREPFDPMEKALRHLGTTFLARTEHLHANWELVHEYPLSPELLVLSRVWKSPDGSDWAVAAKGSPEAIAELCHFDAARGQETSRQATAMADEGLRVLGVARGISRHPELPPGQHDFEFEFLGLVGLADPVRPGVREAVAECAAAGIRVVMITGDYPGTAQNIGRQIGLARVEQVITGPELDRLSDEDLTRRIRDVNLFARVVPEQKLRLVNALKANGEVVAMTGDGVNDAPALKAAHIGVAMGGRGTDVAREAASLVVLDDDFASIVAAVRMGRRIFDNIRKAVSYIFAIHVPIAGLSLFPVFFGKLDLILLPVHIVFLELIIDPSCSVVFEAEEAEPDVMRRPPRRAKERLFNLRSVGLSLVQGASVLAIVLAVYLIAPRFGDGPDEQRALAFTTLVVANLGLILTNRFSSRTILSTLSVPNGALWWVLGGAATFMGLILYVPFLRGLFRFDPLSATDLVICFVAGVTSILWFEIVKMVHARRSRVPASGG